MTEKLELGLDEIGVIAQKLCELLEERKIVLLFGDLGAGKTTLVKEVCKQLSISDNTSSPSFGIVNEYQSLSGQKLFHIDLYRVRDIDEFWSIGGIEYIESGYPCFIEWPEKIEWYIETSNLISLKIEHSLNSDKREYEIELK